MEEKSGAKRLRSIGARILAVFIELLFLVLLELKIEIDERIKQDNPLPWY